VRWPPGRGRRARQALQRSPLASAIRLPCKR
jgi:hypothetical protein